MKSISLIGILLVGIFAVAFVNNKFSNKQVLRHVVLFKFKDGTDSGQIKKVEDAFRGLPQKIKQVKEFEWGTNVSPENLAQGYTHCFFVTFASDKDRDDYLPHPAHKEFGEILKPYLDKVLVIDYWAKN